MTRAALHHAHRILRVHLNVWRVGASLSVTVHSVPITVNVDTCVMTKHQCVGRGGGVVPLTLIIHCTYSIVCSPICCMYQIR